MPSTASDKSHMELMDFLLHETCVHDLCVIRESGYIAMVVYIDHEDTFLVHPRLQSKNVQSHKYGTLPVTAADGSKVEVPCTYIDVEEGN